jgi:hypothetical protein
MVKRLLATEIDLTPHIREVYDKLPPEHREQLPWEALAGLVNAYLATPQGRKEILDTFLTVVIAAHEMTPKVRQGVWDVLGTKVGILSLSADPTSRHLGPRSRGITNSSL